MEHVIRKADRRHLDDINRLLVSAKMSPLEALPRYCWFVREAGLIVGSVSGIPWHGALIVTRLVVAAEYRKRRIGIALFDHALAHAKTTGASPVALLTMYYHFNRFKRCGFRTYPRKDVPERLMSHPMLTDKRFMKCAVMIMDEV